MDDDIVIGQTKAWINQVVVGCNFCPFAAREVKRGSIRFNVLHSADIRVLQQSLAEEFELLDNDENIATTLIILPGLFPDFRDYLDMIAILEKFLKKKDKEGVYQLASFHPQYLFAGADMNDPANYTNRSAYPMVHLLRESSITDAIANFPDPEGIPERNIAFARRKGLSYMRTLRDACLGNED
jgi:hypothetical protein